MNHCCAWPTGQRRSAPPCKISVGVVTSPTRLSGDMAANAPRAAAALTGTLPARIVSPAVSGVAALPVPGSSAPASPVSVVPSSQALSRCPSSDVPAMDVKSLTAPPATAAANRRSLLVR